MSVRIQFRRGTAAEWTAANPILAEGELAIELDTDLHKIGDGATYWNDLPYPSPPPGGASDASYVIGWAVFS